MSLVSLGFKYEIEEIVLLKDNFVTLSKIISIRRILINFVFTLAYTVLGTVVRKIEIFWFFDVNCT